MKHSQAAKANLKTLDALTIEDQYLFGANPTREVAAAQALQAAYTRACLAEVYVYEYGEEPVELPTDMYCQGCQEMHEAGERALYSAEYRVHVCPDSGEELDDLTSDPTDYEALAERAYFYTA